MSTLIVAALSFFGFILAYNTYGRWLGRKIFGIDKKNLVPSREFNDGYDFVPTRRIVLFGHHFTSIAGTGPIVGPAIAVFWGWLPALLWVVLGSIFVGAVHDFGALVLSIRNKGRSIGDIAGSLISPSARIMLMVLLFLILTLVLAVFGLVIALIFSYFPESVIPVWISLPMAIMVGIIVYRFKGSLFLPSLASLATIYVCIWLGTKYPVDLSAMFHIPLIGDTYCSAVVIWTVILFIYCFLASVLPVWLMLQPRDYVNAVQLFTALGLSIAGVIVASIFGGADIIASAPAIAKEIPSDAPPIWPFLFITIACGAVSGFHSLVSGGTSAKQIGCESDAQPIGYGGMLLEGALAVVVILACTAGVGMGLWEKTPVADGKMPVYSLVKNADGSVVKNVDAWHSIYKADIQKSVDPATGKTVIKGGWNGMKMQQQIEAFVKGAANFLCSLGIPIEVGISLFATLVACFAATTIDTATRLERYVLQELGAAVKFKPLTNKYVATTVAVVSSFSIAVFADPKPGNGGMILWPIFGACNQILAGLGFLLIAMYLLRRKVKVWFIMLPLVLMIVLPAWAMCWNIFSTSGWLEKKDYLLVSFGVASMGLTAWLLVEAAIAYVRMKKTRQER